MSVGRFKSVCLNVTDLEKGFEFWSAMTGWQVLGSMHGWLGYVGTPEVGCEMILIETDVAPIETEPPTHHDTNRVHIDIWPNDGMDNAIADVIALGGTLKKPPSLYPRPGSYGDDLPLIDWAVMQDPFGNEFCIVEDLTQEQIDAVAAADATTDHEWRVAAGQTI